MRKPFSLLLPAALLVAVAAWWTLGEPAVSIVPGWHTPILTPYAAAAFFGSAVLAALALGLLLAQLRGTNGSRRRP